MSNPRKAKGSKAEADVVNLSAWVKELEVEIKNDNAWTGVVLHKRIGKGDVGEWYATMPAKIWIELIRKIDGQT